MNAAHPEPDVAPRIEWSEPPRRRHGNMTPDPLHVEIARMLKSRPGVWARWPESFDMSRRAYDLRTTIAAGRSSPFRPRGAFEAAVRSTPEGRLMWVRYVGETRLFRADEEGANDE